MDSELCFLTVSQKCYKLLKVCNLFLLHFQVWIIWAGAQEHACQKMLRTCHEHFVSAAFYWFEDLFVLSSIFLLSSSGSFLHLSTRTLQILFHFTITLQWELLCNPNYWHKGFSRSPLYHIDPPCLCRPGRSHIKSCTHDRIRIQGTDIARCRSSNWELKYTVICWIGLHACTCQENDVQHS